MDPMPVIFDISSDEEPCCDEPKGDDYNWLSELLNAVDKVTDDSDEVVVVGEVNPKQRSKSWKSTPKDEDDDCVVLDGDPDNPVPFVNDSAGGSDEVLIVGEKGQVYVNLVTFAVGSGDYLFLKLVPCLVAQKWKGKKRKEN